MSRKRKTLPKDFDELIKSEDISSLKRIFDKCNFNAYGGYAKQSALGFNNCPDELSIWLVENGADLHYKNTYGDTPLHLRASSQKPNADILIMLGANVNQPNKSGNTPLHSAAGYQRIESAEVLLAAGSKISVKNLAGLTPLEYGLQRCSNIDIPRMRDLTEVFHRHGAEITHSEKNFVNDIGQRFEFHRDGFNKDSVEDVSTALSALYELYDVLPVPSRIIHDGVSIIEISGDSWEQQYNNLWDDLIPSKGPALTVQGEVVRIAGRISDEVLRNGGGNWDMDYRKMCNAFIKHVGSGNALEKDEISYLHDLLSDFDCLMNETNRLQIAAVKWISKNTNPIKLDEPKYSR